LAKKIGLQELCRKWPMADWYFTGFDREASCFVSPFYRGILKEVPFNIYVL